MINHLHHPIDKCEFFGQPSLQTFGKRVFERRIRGRVGEGGILGKALRIVGRKARIAVGSRQRHSEAEQRGHAKNCRHSADCQESPHGGASSMNRRFVANYSFRPPSNAAPDIARNLVADCRCGGKMNPGLLSDRDKLNFNVKFN